MKFNHECTSVNPELKLNRTYGMLAATLGSVCDYSAEALLDRIKLVVAIIEDDKEGMATYGRVCQREQAEQHPEIFCPE